MDALRLHALVTACRVLFGTPYPKPASRESAWPQDLKTAHRARVLDTHPDRARSLGIDAEVLAGRFREVQEAYTLLSREVDCWDTLLQTYPSVRSTPPTTTRSKTTQRPEQPTRARETTRPPTQGATRTPPEPQPWYRRPSTPKTAPASWWAPTDSKSSSTTTKPGWVEATTSSAPTQGSTRFPRHQLRFAEYLHHAGWISRETMEEALAWQRQSRPRLGEIAVQWGWLTEAQVQRLLSLRTREGAEHIPFARYALERGAINTFQQLALVGQQRRLQPPIGKWFVEHGILTEDAVLAVVELQHRAA